ncbi:hypothetical protein Acr_00g0070470 [Actinidia rufa]|uniref:Retrovirus-related Pol polyprotein from transposon TNT 1-94-like beta-barrel domain-containing protein n=1 Tax=Actinidia rufa TaxID=165716 RepID=A0A7J0DRI0_9ERIC|nr:hypothetical protein Acr_00g0070470 [Actinidia rufa]
MADGRFMTLTEVRHVPNLRKNLISIGILDSKGCSFDASGGILRVSKGNKKMLWGKKTRGLYRLEGNVQIGGATVRHRSSGISEKNGQGKQPLHKKVRKASAGVPRGSGVVQEHREMLWDMYGSLARHEWCNQCRMSIEKLRGRRPAPTPNRVRNGVRTRPHAPFEDRRVRSVSAMRPGRSHALPRAREDPRAYTHLGGDCTHSHVSGGEPTHPHARSRAEEVRPRAAMRQGGSITLHTRGRGRPRARRSKMAEHNLGSMIVLSATNYAIWKSRMEDILFCKDLHDPLENKGEKPIATKDEEWRKMNKKMIGLIRQCIGYEVFHHVAQETSAYDLWIKLEEMYQAKTSQNKALLMRRLVNLKLYRKTTVAEHTSEFQNLVNQLTSVDLYNSAPNGKLTTSMVMDALFNEEAWRREMGSTDQREAGKEAEVKEEVITEEGHIKRDCPKYKAQDQSSVTAATAVMAVDESDVLLAASDNGKSNWVLDSGSAYHLCRDREVFSTCAACEGRIWMANNTSTRVVGRGSVWFRMADGRSMTLTEVRHVPNLRKNLISIGILDSKGCSFDASGGILRVSKGNKKMLWGKKTRGLYRLEGNVQIGGATVRHGSSGISEKEWTREAIVAQRYAKQAQGYLEDPEWYKSTGRCFGICTEVWPDTSGATSAGCP